MVQRTIKKTRAKDASEGRGNSVKYCRDCEEATVHSTGSQLWVSCRFQSGWLSGCGRESHQALLPASC